MLSREFLIERGYCCGHGCLMCPYEPKHTKGNTIMSDSYGSASELDKKILLVCALEVETQGKEWLKDFDVVYTGVGKVNATYALTTHFGKYGSYIPYSLVINYGTAGSRKIKKKQLVDCTKFIQRDMDVTGLGFMRGETPFEDDPPLTIKSTSEFNPINRNALCGSGDNFVEDKTNYYGEVVDMEAYALAKVCYKRQVPFISFKYITDGADEQAHEDWEANLAQGIEEFHKRVISKID
tara:strand:- start:112 stop:825 length:714 start_codon:yes stop_codon:yes gene_type:complete